MGLIEFGTFTVLSNECTLLDGFGLRFELLEVGGVYTANKLLLGNFVKGSVDAVDHIGGLVDLTWKSVQIGHFNKSLGFENQNIVKLAEKLPLEITTWKKQYTTRGSEPKRDSIE